MELFSSNILLVLVIIVIFAAIIAVGFSDYSSDDNNEFPKVYNFDINGHEIIVYQYRDKNWPSFNYITWFEIHVPKKTVSIYEKIVEEIATYSQFGGSAIKRRKQLYINGKPIFDTWEGKAIIDEHEVNYRPDYYLYDNVNKDYYVITVYYVWRNVEQVLDAIKEATFGR